MDIYTAIINNNIQHIKQHYNTNTIANLDIPTTYNMLIFSCEYDHKKITKYLVNLIINNHDTYYGILKHLFVAVNISIELLKTILEHDTNGRINRVADYFLFVDITNKCNLDIINILVSNGLDPNMLLELAIIDNKLDVVEFLLNHNAIIRKGYIYICIGYDFTDMVELLLDHGAIIRNGHVDNCFDHHNPKILTIFLDHGFKCSPEQVISCAYKSCQDPNILRKFIAVFIKYDVGLIFDHNLLVHMCICFNVPKYQLLFNQIGYNLPPPNICRKDTLINTFRNLNCHINLKLYLNKRINFYSCFINVDLHENIEHFWIFDNVDHLDDFPDKTYVSNLINNASESKFVRIKDQYYMPLFDIFTQHHRDSTAKSLFYKSTDNTYYLFYINNRSDTRIYHIFCIVDRQNDEYLLLLVYNDFIGEICPYENIGYIYTNNCGDVFCDEDQDIGVELLDHFSPNTHTITSATDILRTFDIIC